MANYIHAGLITLGILSIFSCDTKTKKVEKASPPKQITPTKKKLSKKVINIQDQDYESIKENTSFNIVLQRPEDGKNTTISGSETVYHNLDDSDSSTESTLQGPIETIDLIKYFYTYLLTADKEESADIYCERTIPEIKIIDRDCYNNNDRQEKINQYSDRKRSTNNTTITSKSIYKLKKELHILNKEHGTSAVLKLNYINDEKIYESDNSFTVLGNQITGFLLKTRNHDDPEAVHISKRMDMVFDGHMLDSYQVNNKLYITSLFTPRRKNALLTLNTDSHIHQQQTASQVNVSDLLPKMTYINTNTTEIQTEQCIIPGNARQNKGIITLITEFDMESGDYKNICFTGHIEKSFIKGNYIYLYSFRAHDTPPNPTDQENADSVTLHQVTLSTLTYSSTIQL